MSPSELFDKLGAPLKNIRWSWGGIRSSDGAVFLRVWQDGTKSLNGKRYIWISEENPTLDHPGRKERLEHVKHVKEGKPCFLIMCQATDSSEEPREIQSFNQNEVFTTGELISLNGSFWIELKDRIRVNAVRVT